METLAARPAVLRKTEADRRVAPHLRDYAAVRAAFSWDAVRRELLRSPGDAVNIAGEALDRHAAGARSAQVAFRFLSASGGRRDVSFAELARLTNRFANVLAALGVAKGDRLFVLCGRIPELYMAVLGGLKRGAVVSPLFSAFGPEPIAMRIGIGAGKVLVTTEALYRRKVEKIRGELATLEHVLLIGEDSAPTAVPGTRDFGEMMAKASDTCSAEPTKGDDMALLHFTSGTTGRPKGAIHVHDAVVTHYATGKYALDLHPEDIFWCTADPGWVTGTSYGIIAPLLHGVTSVVDAGEFDAERW